MYVCKIYPHFDGLATSFDINHNLKCSLSFPSVDLFDGFYHLCPKIIKDCQTQRKLGFMFSNQDLSLDYTWLQLKLVFSS
jgi:hypothetical protein